MDELLQISAQVDELAREIGEVKMTEEQWFDQEVDFVVGNLMDAFSDPSVITEKTVRTVLSAQR